MSVIVIYNDEKSFHFASDSLVVWGGMELLDETPKFKQVGQFIFGVVGGGKPCMRLERELEEAASKCDDLDIILSGLESITIEQYVEANACAFLADTVTGRAVVIDNDLGSTPIAVYGFWAIGSGAPFALGAYTMLAGPLDDTGICSTVNAAREYDPDCGGDILYQEYPKK